MVDPVVTLLNGRGHRVRKAREVGLDDEEDQILVEYALANSLIVVTFDRDLRDKSLRGGCQCLWIRHDEVTAKYRVADGYREICKLLQGRRPLVVVHPDGRVTAGGD